MLAAKQTADAELREELIQNLQTVGIGVVILGSLYILDTYRIEPTSRKGKVRCFNTWLCCPNYIIR